MIPTIDERKERYYQIVLEKARGVYASWGKNGASSKALVAQAHAYAFDKRLKMDITYRLRALVFTCALSMRIEKRYATFFQKLFRLFAFLRERGALAMLKRVLDMSVNAGIREMIMAELEKIAVQLSKLGEEETRGGGKRVGREDVSPEEAMENFLTENTKEEMQKTDDKELAADTADELSTQDKKTTTTLEPSREQISVDEVQQNECLGRGKKEPLKEVKMKGLEVNERAPKETVEHVNEEKPIEKSVGNTSVLVETRAIEQDRGETLSSPFPSVQENGGGGLETEQNAPNETKEQPQAFANEQGEIVEQNAPAKSEPDKTLFPVFNVENGSGNSPEKPMEKPEEKSTTKESKVAGKDFLAEMKVSEENKARIELNVTMTKQQIEAIVMQLKEMANIEMSQREQVSIKIGRASCRERVCLSV